MPKDELKRYKEAAQKEGMPFRAWVLKQLKKAAICAALVGIAAISIGMASRPAADTHVVQPGDTWWSIVEKFRDEDRYVLEYKSEMERLNGGIDTGNLKPGQILRIQYRTREGGKNGQS